MQTILHARAGNRAGVEWCWVARLALGQHDLNLEFVVLRPVIEDLVRDLQSGGLALGVQFLKLRRLHQVVKGSASLL